MFHGATKILTLISVIFHAGVGCCAHHDHHSGINSPIAAAERQDPENTDHCNCKYHAHRSTAVSEDDEPENSPCPCGENHEGCVDHCSWLTNSKVELPADCGFVLPLATTDDLCFSHAATSALVGRALHGSPPLLCKLTDTLRAKNQVWRL